jgi:hypothetical protein
MLLKDTCYVTANAGAFFDFLSGQFFERMQLMAFKSGERITPVSSLCVTG